MTTRRLLLAGLASTTFACAQPLTAQQAKRVGVLLPWPEKQPNTRARANAFTQALASRGWIEGKNLRIDYRFAAGDPTLFNAYAEDLVNLSPDAILASTPLAVAAVQRRTSKIPIVFVLVIDPVGMGLVQSLARPGGMITGFGASESALMGKWLELLKDVDPRVTRAIVLYNPDTQPYAASFNGALAAAAPSLSMAVTLAPVHNEEEIESAVTRESRERGSAIIALPDAFNVTHRKVLISSALRERLPSIGFGETFPQSGALLSYWFDETNAHAEAASYIDRILRGDSPADLPVQRPTRYSLIVNLTTAKSLGITVPQSILRRADEVIE
jgi:putative ABC transport system substrate-binding protein